MKPVKPLYLKSEAQVYEYLKKFLHSKPQAVQLDGSTVAKPNSNVILVFRYSVNGQQYKLLGDLTRNAAETFLDLVAEHGNAGIVLKEYKQGQNQTLILSTMTQPNGWSCSLYVEKSSQKRKAA